MVLVLFSILVFSGSLMAQEQRPKANPADLESSIEMIVQGSITKDELVQAIIAQEKTSRVNRSIHRLEGIRKGYCFITPTARIIQWKVQDLLSFWSDEINDHEKQRLNQRDSLQTKCDVVKDVQKELHKRLQSKNARMAFRRSDDEEIQDKRTKRAPAISSNPHDHSVRAPAIIEMTSSPVD